MNRYETSSNFERPINQSFVADHRGVQIYLPGSSCKMSIFAYKKDYHLKTFKSKNRSCADVYLLDIKNGYGTSIN